MLQGRAKEDYLLERFQGGRKLYINIHLATGKGLNMFYSLSNKSFLNRELSCGMKCNMIWDGYGRWNGRTWKPYLKAKRSGTNDQNSSVIKWKSSPYDTLWIYGDSHGRRMYEEVSKTALCQSIFKSCKCSKNWVYSTSDKGLLPGLNFDYKKITNDMEKVLKRLEMSENNVMVLNLGLHYVRSTNFSNYQNLLRGVVGLFKGNAEKRRLSVRMIWKTTTPVHREYSFKQHLILDQYRFYTNPRIAMYNAYATSLMCREGFELLDVHPSTGSYPDGTGDRDVKQSQHYDVVHYEPIVTAPFEEALADYLSGKLPEKLSLENYEFS